MSKVNQSAEADAAPDPIVAIELRRPHTHAGREYPVGAILAVSDIGMTPEDAAWLIGIGVAVRA